MIFCWAMSSSQTGQLQTSLSHGQERLQAAARNQSTAHRTMQIFLLHNDRIGP